MASLKLNEFDLDEMRYANFHDRKVMASLKQREYGEYRREQHHISMIERSWPH